VEKESIGERGMGVGYKGRQGQTERTVELHEEEEEEEEVVSMPASGTLDRGFAPDRRRRIFPAEKNPQHAFLRRGSKIICPMSQLWGHVKEPSSLRKTAKLLAKFH
jgi:hypothetical protein